MVVHSDGGVWFTDPTYGIRNNYGGSVDQSELPTHVYRFDPASGEATVAVSDLAEPNGLCFSPDERLLYVVETAPAAGKPVPILVFDVIGGRKLANRRVFGEIAKGGADGIRCDVDGNLWTAAGGGEGQDAVRVFASDGTLIGKILLPEVCANLCFGGRKRNRLFLAASQSLYAVYVNTQGAQVP